MHLSRPMIVSGGILLLLFASGLILFPHLPASMAVHWNAQGVADGYWPKGWALFLTPVLALVLGLFLAYLPRLDPLRQNIEEFRDTYEWFVAGFLLYFLYIHLLILAWNLGFRFSLMMVLSPAFAALLYGCGILIGRAKRNWFIGIRTPWTLSSDHVWDVTHERGALLFRLAGLVALGGVLLPGLAIAFILVPVLAITVYLVVFSYREYRREQLAGPRELSAEHLP